MRALGFVGATRQAAAQRLLPALIQQWREQWCLPSGAGHGVTCVAENPESLAAESPRTWLMAANDKGSLWLSGSWHNIVFGAHAGDAPQDEVAAHLLARAQQALAHSILDSLGKGAASELQTQAPVALGQALNPRLLLQVDCGGHELVLLLDAALFDEHLPRPQPRQALTERSKAIGGVKLQLKVRLPFASLPLGDVSNLSPGDILQGATHFLEPLNLTVADTQTVAQGFLARRDEHLALQLTAHEES